MTPFSLRKAAALAAAALVAASVAAPIALTAGPAGAAVADAPAAARTRLTYVVDGCEGCRVQLTNAEHEGRGRPSVWTSPTRTVRDGTVTFDVRSERTWGMSVSIEAPWEGHTGYRTSLVQRYAGHGVGDPVGVDEATDARRASSCWAGTRQPVARIFVEVHRVEVAGVRGPVPGALAFTTTTQDWEGNMRPAPAGVLGTQDAEVCR